MLFQGCKIQCIRLIVVFWGRVTRIRSHDNSLGAKMWDSFYLCLWLPLDMTPQDHGKVRQMHSFVPHSHAIRILLMLKDICLSSLPWLFLLLWEIELGSSIHDVLLCEYWIVSNHRWRRTFLINPFILLIYFFNISSWCIFSVLEFWLFILALLAFIL